MQITFPNQENSLSIVLHLSNATRHCFNACSSSSLYCRAVCSLNIFHSFIAFFYFLYQFFCGSRQRLNFYLHFNSIKRKQLPLAFSTQFSTIDWTNLLVLVLYLRVCRCLQHKTRFTQIKRIILRFGMYSTSLPRSIKIHCWCGFSRV